MNFRFFVDRNTSRNYHWTKWIVFPATWCKEDFSWASNDAQQGHCTFVNKDSRLSRMSFLSEGWVKTDVGFMVRKWIARPRLVHTVQVACTTCSIDRDTAPVSTELTLKPFLVIHTAPLPQRNRPKRNSNCLPEMKECCRDELYINFEDIGWSDWILHPSGYNAYFCRGSCSSAASLTMSGSPYNNVIRVSAMQRIFTSAVDL